MNTSNIAEGEGDLRFFLRGEVILDSENLPHLLGSFASDHIGDSLASYVSAKSKTSLISPL